MTIEFDVLGTLHAVSDGAEVPIPRPAQRRLLSILLLRSSGDVSKDELIECMWGDAAPLTVDNTLHAHIAGLRRILGPDTITTTERGYGLGSGDQPADVVRFDALCDETERLLSEGRPYEALDSADAALALWRGRPYVDIEGDEFALSEIHRLEERHAAALESRFEACAALNRLAGCIPDLEAATREWPLRERFREFQMLALYRAGRQADALRVFQDIRNTLGEELGIEPGSGLTELENRILLQDPSLGGSDTVAARHNLPKADTAFVGREPDLDQVVELLGKRSLVTLTGPGGVGKTRLALEVGHRALSSFNSGVWFVDLSTVHDERQVPYTLAETLGVPEHPDLPVTDVVASYIEDRSLLLILDNCEHLLEATTALIRTMRSASPRLTILATSRERIGVEGESTWVVKPLTVPDPRSSAVGGNGHEAVDLFLDRARQADPTFVLTPANDELIVSICRRLDGLPLAIELAAARIDVLSLSDIERRLSDNLSVIDRHARHQPVRHATLAGAVRWSYELLDVDERLLFERLSVFSGTFLLDDVEEICIDEHLPADRILDVLTRLVGKSLVVVHTSATLMTRYSMLDTLRAFAVDAIAEAGNADEIATRHMERYLALAEEAEPQLLGVHQREWLELLDADHDNLRLAFDRLLAGGRVEDALRMGAALRWFWKMHDNVAEGTARLEAALSVDEDVSPIVRSGALIAVAALKSATDVDGTYPMLEEAADIAANAGDELRQGVALGWMGLFDRVRGDLDASCLHLSEALLLVEGTGEDWAVGFVLGHLAVLARERSNLAEAAEHHKRALALARRLGNAQDEAWNVAGLGTVFLYQGDYQQAIDLLEQSHEVAHDIGFDFESTTALILLATSKARVGDADEASSLLTVAHERAAALSSPRLLDAVLRATATVESSRGDLVGAARLLGSADRIRAENELTRGMFQSFFDADETRIRSMLGDDDFSVAWEAGQVSIIR